MGDFEDVFGAGADAVDIIDSISQGCVLSSRSKESIWRSESPCASSKGMGGKGTWSSTMEEKGYTLGPQFSSYEDLSAWDTSNARSHVRSRTEHGYQIYFTDGQPRDTPESEQIVTDPQPPSKFDNDPPF
ncbi:hypothetical protein [Sulfitobacter geojensis]|uniref:hypothetical protein n=1 Tax=Sulfitobacter geojensis TaxID=1342299 RepID=UPI0012DC0A17|nr:hypothetical protein [Sulfitobacter geojensis]NYI28221.1 hypothetical protein [Sulfitobacter geojensis]